MRIPDTPSQFQNAPSHETIVAWDGAFWNLYKYTIPNETEYAILVKKYANQNTNYYPMKCAIQNNKYANIDLRCFVANLRTFWGYFLKT